MMCWFGGTANRGRCRIALDFLSDTLNDTLNDARLNLESIQPCRFHQAI
jgi:hypothetical protein